MPVNFGFNPQEFKSKLGGLLDLDKRAFRTKIRRALVEEAQHTQERIYERVRTHPNVKRRSGKLLRTISRDERKLVKGGTTSDTAFTVNLGMVNFDHADDDPKLHNVNAAAAVLTKDPYGTPTIMEARSSKKLAIPIPGSSPTDIITRGGVKLKTVREVEASGVYKKLLYLPKSIMGVPHDRKEKLVFLFARKESVKVTSRINLLKEARRFKKNFIDRIAEVLVDYAKPKSARKRKSNA